MNTHIAQFLAVFAFLCTPSLAAASLAPHISTPCALSEQLHDVHTEILYIARTASDIGEKAENLRHTSRWRSYRQVEVSWSEVRARVLSTLIKLSDLPLSLETLSNQKTKKFAEHLISVDQNALEEIIDYASVALYLERTENSLSKNLQPNVFSFGVSKAEIPATYNAIAQNHFLARFTAVEDALHTLTIPEKHYIRACHLNSWERWP